MCPARVFEQYLSILSLLSLPLPIAPVLASTQLLLVRLAGSHGEGEDGGAGAREEGVGDGEGEGEIHQSRWVFV